MLHTDGIANIALGLGKSVVEGKLNFRFCPRYPETEMLPQQEMMRTSQKEFFALDLSVNDFDLTKGEEITLAKLTIRDAEKHEVLRYIASVWDYENYRLTDNLDEKGMKVLCRRVEVSSLPSGQDSGGALADRGDCPGYSGGDRICCESGI